MYRRSRYCLCPMGTQTLQNHMDRASAMDSTTTSCKTPWIPNRPRLTVKSYLPSVPLWQSQTLLKANVVLKWEEIPTLKEMDTQATSYTCENNKTILNSTPSPRATALSYKTNLWTWSTPKASCLWPTQHAIQAKIRTNLALDTLGLVRVTIHHCIPLIRASPSTYQRHQPK